MLKLVCENQANDRALDIPDELKNQADKKPAHRFETINNYYLALVKLLNDSGYHHLRFLR
jgi:hypothetical protein